MDRVRLFVEILTAYAPMLVVLRTNDLRRMVATARATPGRPAAPVPGDRAHVVARRLGWILLSSLSVLPTDKRCLVRSLVMIRLLERRGIEATLVVGVLGGEAFAAHAWVEHDGQPVLPPGEYERLAEF